MNCLFWGGELGNGAMGCGEFFAQLVLEVLDFRSAQSLFIRTLIERRCKWMFLEFFLIGGMLGDSNLLFRACFRLYHTLFLKMMEKGRALLKVVGILLAPLVVFVGVIFVGGILDYNEMGMMMMALAVACLAAIALWGFWVLLLLTRLMGRLMGLKHREFYDDEQGF